MSRTTFGHAIAAVLLLGCCSRERGTMPTPTHFLSVHELQVIGGAAASKRLPDEDADTFPIPLWTDDGLVILVMYFKEGGPPGQRVVYPPHYVMYLDGETGKVLRFKPCKPEDLGIHAPIKPVPGVDVDPTMPADEYIRKSDRFFTLSPDVWRAYAAGSTKVSPAVAAEVKEYVDIFRSIVKKEEAPFYVAASPHYFTWLFAVASH